MVNNKTHTYLINEKIKTEKKIQQLKNTIKNNKSSIIDKNRYNCSINCEMRKIDFINSLLKQEQGE